MDIALGAITNRGGMPWVLSGLGIVGYWDSVADNTGKAVRTAAEILRETTPSDREGSWRSSGVSLGIGVVSLEGWRKSRNEAASFAFRLASLAHPNGGLVSEPIYEETVERFDYRGVCPVVPRSDPLPQPVFKLVGAKPEISGTHQASPDTIRMVGRHELLKVLDDCCREVTGGRLVVLHLIGEPGTGKSRLLRDWLHANERSDRLAGWMRLGVHGVPYGGYPLRAWSHLVKSLMGSDASAFVLRRSDAVKEMIDHLGRLVRPAMIIVDDLHWIDAPSRILLDQLVNDSTIPPVFVVLAYRPSFAKRAPYRKAPVHRRVLVRGLERTELDRLIETIARDRKVEMPSERRQEITDKGQGNPLYVIEAIRYLADTGTNISPGLLPSSLSELLIQRIQRTLDVTLPEIEQEVRLSMARLAFTGDSKSTLGRLEMLEEQVSAWLDRFDAVQQESPSVVRKFLRGLKEIDSRLAVLSIFLGRQRPHYYRLAQALARIEEKGSPRTSER